MDTCEPVRRQCIGDGQWKAGKPTARGQLPPPSSVWCWTSLIVEFTIRAVRCSLP